MKKTSTMSLVTGTPFIIDAGKTEYVPARYTFVMVRSRDRGLRC